MNALDLGEVDDLVELPVDLRLAHAEDRAVQVDVLPAGQLGVEARADLEQRADAPVDLGAAVRRLGDPREHLEQRALAGAVAADDAEHLARAGRRRRRPVSAQNVRSRRPIARATDGRADAVRRARRAASRTRSWRSPIR